MTIIYEAKTGKPHTVEHMIDAREAVANGSYTFTLPEKEEPKVVEPKPIAKKVEPVTKKEEPKSIVKKVDPVIKKEEPEKVTPRILKTKK